MEDDESKNLLKAVVALLIENRSDDARRLRKDEILLGDNGLKPQEIAKILGKTQAAITKTIQRARKS